MSWEYKANWPLKEGDEITHVFFEDLRKLFYSLRYGIYGTNTPGWYGDVKEWAVATDFLWGGFCTFEGYLYQFCEPIKDEDDKPRPSPGVSTLWVRTARQWVYSDFNPSNACYVPQWYDTEEEWINTPAWMMLPAPLDPYVQKVRQINEDPLYERIRPAEEEYEYGAKRAVPFRRYYNDSRDTFGFLVGGGPKQIISGVLGALYDGSFSYTRNYHLPSGVPHIESPNYDAKMGGYQGYGEWLAESNRWMHETNAHFVWEFYDDGTGFVDDPVFERPKPLIAELRDYHWRCNNSAYEAVLKILGTSHYDWYLSSKPSGEGDPDGDRIACWRRMPKYSHYWPVYAIRLWPGELGVPPYADETFAARTDTSTVTGFEAAINWWKVVGNYNTVISETDAALALAGEETLKDFDERHSYVQRLWFRDEDCPVPAGYSSQNVTVGGEVELWWYADAYRLRYQLLNQLKDVMEKLSILRIDASFEIEFDQYSQERASAAWNERQESFTDARDYGSTLSEVKHSPSGLSKLVVGWGEVDSFSQQTAVDSRHLPTWDPDAEASFRRNVNFGELFGVVRIKDGMSEEIEQIIDVVSSVRVYLGIQIGGAAALRGLAFPSDDDVACYNISDIAAGNIDDLPVYVNPYQPLITRWLEFNHIPQQVEYNLRTSQNYQGMWTKVPPTQEFDAWAENWVPDVTSSILHAVIEVHPGTPLMGVGVDPHLVSLKDYLMDDFCPPPIE